MFGRLLLLILPVVFIVHADIAQVVSNDDPSSASDRVRVYFEAANSTYWLENSNKIAMGYNPRDGAPVCYTGVCQMEGFRRAVFKLSYRQPAAGACTTKYVPDHVELDCISSASLHATTEVISELRDLETSIRNSVEVNVGGTIQGALFSYATSVETRYMIDNIVQRNRTVLKTTAQVSYVKLSLFEPQMELADDFRYVIDNLPCCNYTDEAKQYIYDYVFGYFGFAFLTEILLGGNAQQTVLTTKESYSRMESKGLDIMNQAGVDFYITVGAQQEYSYDRTSREEFLKAVQERHTTTLGGDSSLTTLEEWSTTVKANPVVIRFKIKSILELLNQRRFPNDTFIGAKAALISQALNDYVMTPVYCYENCTGHGTCVPQGYFRFGTCQCYTGYSGVDCSTLTTTTPQMQHRPAFSTSIMPTFDIALLIISFLYSFSFATQ